MSVSIFLSDIFFFFFFRFSLNKHLFVLSSEQLQYLENEIKNNGRKLFGHVENTADFDSKRNIMQYYILRQYDRRNNYYEISQYDIMLKEKKL